MLGARWDPRSGTSVVSTHDALRQRDQAAVAARRAYQAKAQRRTRTAGQQAVTLRTGTWHPGLIAPEGGDFVVIERHADAVDCEPAKLITAVTSG